MSADDPNKHTFDDIFPDDDAEQAEAQSPADDAPESTAPDDDASAEQDTNGPVSAAPPRIVAEAPLGGVSRSVPTPSSDAAPEPDHTADPEPEPDSDAPPPVAESGGDDAPPAAPEPDSDAPMPGPAVATMQGDTEPPDAGAAPDAHVPPPHDDAAPPVTPDQPAPESDRTPEAQIAARLKKLQARESGAAEDAADAAAAEREPAGATSPEPEGSTSPAPRPPEPDTAPVTSSEAGELDEPTEWDEDLSPELAAVLFGGQRAQAAPAADETPPEATETPEVAPAESEVAAEDAVAAPAPDTAPQAAEPEPEPAPEPDAPPIELTDIGEVRTLPITAERRAAPAPDTALDGKARYIRVEEPLGDDAGQRTLETWEYLKPAYPTLGGREVREVRVEEMGYSDGSWLWRYERRYADRGRDSREVRANPDRTYIEREDIVSRLAADSGRRLQFKETAELIHAAPPQPEKKGGLLSGLGNLLGRDDDDDEAQAGPMVWRQATQSEMRSARKQGGEAFKRGLLDGLIG